jgi:hypothetical protein
MFIDSSPPSAQWTRLAHTSLSVVLTSLSVVLTAPPAREMAAVQTPTAQIFFIGRLPFSGAEG